MHTHTRDEKIKLLELLIKNMGNAIRHLDDENIYVEYWLNDDPKTNGYVPALDDLNRYPIAE